MTQAPTEALATIRDNLKTITEQYDHPDWGDPEHNIITALETLHQTLDNLQAEEEQQLTAAVALNAINLDAFHTHVLQLLGAHFTKHKTRKAYRATKFHRRASPDHSICYQVNRTITTPHTQAARK